MKKYLLTLAFIFAANNALACASGCGISNVGTSSIIPNSEGGTFFTQYDYIAQTRNWSGDSKSSNENHHQRIETQTITLGTQYMFNRDFGINLRVPYVTRRFTDQSSGHGFENHMAGAGGFQNQIAHEGHHHDDEEEHAAQSQRISRGNSSIGDIRISGIYSGLFNDMSTGFILGMKLPTGQTSDKTFSRSLQIGTGSYDAILGFYHKKSLGKSNFGYFVQSTLEKPFIYHESYKPGQEISSGIGAFYNHKQSGLIKSITPILQVTYANKSRDRGLADIEHNSNSGYKLVYFNPGLEIALDDYKLYFDVGLPLYRSVKGTQLVAQNTFKVILGYNF